MIDALPGRSCASIRRFQHRFADHPPSEPGPIEFTWDDGTRLTLDANADWTLNLSSKPWADPYADASELERNALAQEVGLWEAALIPIAMSRLIGQAVTSAAPEFNEFGELTGLSVAFEEQVVGVRVVGGELIVRVVDR
ncbi:hypothetical protein [Austwickia chelonae]|uniref:Uncharacterized protein n=1 Tax=Austwickia chelonae NBRC 105200 TaxID=1184607 RepID=K6V7H8_9MICO|nr:hypothetical protein [Austwickia chelonae]GAB78178.1 hypothetical protein AUCHE_08_04230 [Austwickia chelonae NBRC 105200]